MGYLRSRFGIGKQLMGYGLGVFHLFLSVSFLTGSDGGLQFGTGLLLVLVGSGMILWGYSHRGSD